MGQAGKDKYLPVRNELFRLFEQHKPISEEKILELCEGQSKGKVKKIKRLIKDYNLALLKGYEGLKLKLISLQPSVVELEDYKDQIIFKNTRRKAKPFSIFWASEKFSAGFETFLNAKTAVDAIVKGNSSKKTNPRNLTSKIDYSGAGYIYVAVNESLPEMVKIGMTTISVEQRMKELSNTSVPTPFSAIAVFEVPSEVRATEKKIHEKLKDIRIHAQREFFIAVDQFEICKEIYLYLKLIINEGLYLRLYPDEGT